MKPFRLFWELHKWAGLALGVVLLLSAVTGFLLLIKKRADWIMPPTASGTAGPVEQLRPMHEVYGAVFGLGLAELRSEADIDRVDFRPEKRVFKVIATRGDREVQVDATTLAVLSVGLRRSDFLERLHDGSAFGAWSHGLLFPLTAIGLALLSVTGYLVWLWPKLIARRARRRRIDA